MPTQKQLQANRLNAQRSAGPISVQGRTRSAWNALKSGIHAESEILPWENSAEREILRGEYHDHHQPITPEERLMVDALVHGEFLHRRFRRAEVTLIVSKLPADADLDDLAVRGRATADAGIELGRLQRRMDVTNRGYHRDLDELRLLKAERPIFEPAPPLILVRNQPDPEPEPEPHCQFLAGIDSIVTQLCQNLTPDQLATLTLAEAAALQKAQPPAPGPQPPAANLSTAQPTESETETEQLGSFRNQPEPEPPTPTPGPPAPVTEPQAPIPNPQPPIPNPGAPGPQPQLGQIYEGCNWGPYPEHLRPGRR